VSPSVQSEREKSHPLISHLPAARLAPYLAAMGNEAGALSLYEWNARMSGSFHEALGLTEIVLRNALDRELRAWNAHRPPERGTTYTEEWVKHPARPLWGILNPAHRGGGRKSTYLTSFKRACQARDRRNAKHPRFGAQVTHDDVVAHITFGTWNNLIPRRDDHGRTRPPGQGVLWDNAIKYAFPGHPDSNVIKFWVERLLHLRNRIAHLEPLIDCDVIGYHRTTVRLLRAIDSRVGDWHAGTSSVVVVCRDRPVRR
jgi:hypothetical protein